jgi:hypothetical protein
LVLDRVVQESCDYEIGIFSVAGFRDETCDFKKMIDVRLLR